MTTTEDPASGSIAHSQDNGFEAIPHAGAGGSTCQATR